MKKPGQGRSAAAGLGWYGLWAASARDRCAGCPAPSLRRQVLCGLLQVWGFQHRCLQHNNRLGRHRQAERPARQGRGGGGQQWMAAAPAFARHAVGLQSATACILPTTPAAPSSGAAPPPHLMGCPPSSSASSGGCIDVSTTRSHTRPGCKAGRRVRQAAGASGAASSMRRRSRDTHLPPRAMHAQHCSYIRECSPAAAAAPRTRCVGRGSLQRTQPGRPEHALQAQAQGVPAGSGLGAWAWSGSSGRSARLRRLTWQTVESTSLPHPRKRCSCRRAPAPPPPPPPPPGPTQAPPAHLRPSASGCLAASRSAAAAAAAPGACAGAGARPQSERRAGRQLRPAAGGKEGGQAGGLGWDWACVRPRRLCRRRSGGRPACRLDCAPVGAGDSTQPHGAQMPNAAH